MEHILDKRIHRQHKFGFKIALIVAVFWTGIDIFVKNQVDLIIAFDTSIVVITIGAMIAVRESEQRFAQLIGFGFVTYLIVGSSIIQFVISPEILAEFVYNEIIVFTGCGMFFYWKWQWSIVLAALNMLTIGITYNYLWEGSFLEFINSGGLLTTTLFFLMLISIELRIQQLRRDTMKTVALQDAEKRNSQLIDSAKDGVIMIDEKGLIVLINPAAQQMFGHPEEDTIGKSIDLLVPDHIQNERARQAGRMVEIGSKIENELQLHAQHSDGHTFPIETSISKLKIEGNIHYTAIVRDITEQVQAREQLIESKKLAEKSKEMQSVFLSNMSHEIRTPMNGVIGLSNLLEETQLDETQLKYLHAIQNSSRNLMVILNDILDFSKIEAGKMTFENIPFNLKYQIDNALEVMSVRAQERNLELNVNYAADLPEELMGDPVRLIQVINNLIGNGLKFTNKGGVTVRIKSEEMDDKNAQLTFEVADTGIGIPEEKLDDIFSSFTQSSASTTREYGGTGLGLTISKQLVEHMGGSIWVTSNYGEGSVFAFQIPFEIAQVQEILSNQEEPKSKKRASRLSAIEGKRILLVEDNEINQLVAMTALKNWNLEVELANNGVEGLQAFQENEYDLILMDIHMPEMDGYETTKKIRELEQKSGGHIPIIAMTASALIGDNMKCIEVGMDDYISKPFEPDNLMRKIYRGITGKNTKAAS